jgi:hypothetical protein
MRACKVEQRACELEHAACKVDMLACEVITSACKDMLTSVESHHERLRRHPLIFETSELVNASIGLYYLGLIEPLAVRPPYKARRCRSRGFFFQGSKMRKVAILVDLGFFLPRYRALIEESDVPPHTPKQVAKALWHTARNHVDRKAVKTSIAYSFTTADRSRRKRITRSQDEPSISERVMLTLFEWRYITNWFASGR